MADTRDLKSLALKAYGFESRWRHQPQNLPVLWFFVCKKKKKPFPPGSGFYYFLSFKFRNPEGFLYGDFAFFGGNRDSFEFFVGVFDYKFADFVFDILADNSYKVTGAAFVAVRFFRNGFKSSIVIGLADMFFHKRSTEFIKAESGDSFVIFYCKFMENNDFVNSSDKFRTEELGKSLIYFVFFK